MEYGNFHRIGWAMIGMIVFGACSVSGRNTDHIPAVTGFDFSRYLGVWYEIVRSDNRFERDLVNVTATYTKAEDGRITVVNRGYDGRKGIWKTARAKGKYDPDSDRGFFRVTFFWPFGADYKVIEIGSDYEYAVVTSRSIRYFWILARTPAMDPEKINSILERARSRGFDVSGFIRVRHESTGSSAAAVE